MSIHISADSGNLTKTEALALSQLYATIAEVAPEKQPERSPFGVTSPGSQPELMGSTTEPEPAPEVEPVVELSPAPEVEKSEPVVESSTSDLDTDGIPWDARIHANSKLKNADGRYKKKRGVDDAFYEQVKAELSGGASSTPKEADPSVAGFVTNAPTAQTDSVSETPTVEDAPVTSPSTEQTLTWPQVLTTISQAGLQDADVAAGMLGVGMQGQPFPTLVNHPDKWNDFLKAVGVTQ